MTEMWDYRLLQMWHETMTSEKATGCYMRWGEKSQQRNAKPSGVIYYCGKQREREKKSHSTMGNWVLYTNSQEEKMSISGHFLGMSGEQLLPDSADSFWQLEKCHKLPECICHIATPHTTWSLASAAQHDTSSITQLHEFLKERASLRLLPYTVGLQGGKSPAGFK